MYDHGKPDQGRRLIHAMYDEYERRGFADADRRRLPQLRVEEAA
jgi:hypothetical protein